MSNHELGGHEGHWTLEAWIEHSRELRSDDRVALDLAHSEYERRLEALNHEAARLAARDHLYVSADKFDAFTQTVEETRAAFERRYVEAHAALSDRINALAAERKGAATTWARIGTTLTVLFLAISAFGYLIYLITR